MATNRTTHKGHHDQEGDKFKEIPRLEARNRGNDPESFIAPDFTETTVKIIDIPFICASDGTLIPSPEAALKTRVETDSTNPDICYVGSAASGQLESDPVWRIKRLTSITVGVISSLDIDLADGDELYDNIWLDRESLTYG